MPAVAACVYACDKKEVGGKKAIDGVALSLSIRSSPIHPVQITQFASTVATKGPPTQREG